MTALAFLVPGALDQLTGGYLFDRRVIEGLRAKGQAVEVIELPGRFPMADSVAIEAATRALAGLPDGSRAVIDGLALPGFASCLATESRRLRLLAFVHHPLAVEDDGFHAVEARLLPLLRGALCPSRATAEALAAYGVARIAVTPPGTRRPVQPTPRAPAGATLRLLTVATLTPRKGHLLLVEALSRLGARAWHWRCVGSATRDPAITAALRAAIARHGLGSRIALDGEYPPAQLDAAYDGADLFVLPSHHEGYGMAFAEALVRGLPILGTASSAIPEIVPESAGLLVPPGNVVALSAALARLCDDRVLLARLAAGAGAAGALLPDWDQAVAAWAAAAERLFA